MSAPCLVSITLLAITFRPGYRQNVIIVERSKKLRYSLHIVPIALFSNSREAAIVCRLPGRLTRFDLR